MSLTLEDIARLSGFSRSTVSRVINDDDNVKEATRRRVLEVIQKINFQPNLAARSLATGHTRVLGLVIPAGVTNIFTDPYYPQLILGVSTACNAQGYSVMMWLAEPEYERRMIGKITHSGLLDGVIVSSMLIDDSIVQSLCDSKVPFILIGRHPTLDVNSLDVDNLSGGREATLTLIQLGRKRIATIAGPQNMIAGYDRYQGYQRGLKEGNIPFDTDLVFEGDFSEASGYAGMRQLLLLREKPDAVFIASDFMAMGAMRALREVGLRIPEDVAIVGFDDMPDAAKTNPPLTTMRQPSQRMGSIAVEKLIEIMRYPEPQTRNVVLPVELVIRKSCGAPSA